MSRDVEVLAAHALERARADVDPTRAARARSRTAQSMLRCAAVLAFVCLGCARENTVPSGDEDAAATKPFSSAPPSIESEAARASARPSPSSLGRGEDNPTAASADPDRPAAGQQAPLAAVPAPISAFEGVAVEREIVSFADGLPSRVAYVHRDPSGASVDHGPDWRWYDNGGIWIRRTWRHGKQSGPFEEFHQSGYPKFKGQYADDQRDGEWLAWYETGAIASVRHWKHGQLDGRSREWTPSGTPKTDALWKDGVQDGAWLFRWPDGRPRQFGAFAAGKRTGAWREWSAEGRLTSMGAYQDDRETGSWLRIDAEGMRFEESYTNGALNGLRRAFDARGRAISEGNYVQGKAHGLQREWNPNGSLKSEIEFENGVQAGRVRYWFEDGGLQIEGLMKAGRREGRWTYWKSDGAIDSDWTGVYHDDKRISG